MFLCPAHTLPTTSSCLLTSSLNAAGSHVPCRSRSKALPTLDRVTHTGCCLNMVTAHCTFVTYGSALSFFPRSCPTASSVSQPSVPTSYQLQAGTSAGLSAKTSTLGLSIWFFTWVSLGFFTKREVPKGTRWKCTVFLWPHLTQHHFCHLSLVMAVMKVFPGSREGKIDPTTC